MLVIRQETSNPSQSKKEKLRIKKRLEKILSVLRCEDAFLSVLITSPEKMRELNKVWRGENRPARILSFPLGECVIEGREARDEEGKLMLGDLAIRFDEKPISDKMLIHGVLHLLGYTHDKEKDYIKMREKEKEVLVKLRKLDKR